MHKTIGWIAQWPKIVWALVLQLLAIGALALIVKGLSFVISPPYPDWALVLGQATIAALLSWRLPYWWRWIQFIIPLGLYAALLLNVSPLLALVSFVLLWLVFRNSVVNRVPLYLTNQITRQALKELVSDRTDVLFIDLGCGMGHNVVYMNGLTNVTQSVGVETAWLPYWWAKFQSLLSGGQVFRQNIDSVDLSQYNLIYAFLSPEPMAQLWRKVQAEMSPNALFVSNSFAIPDVIPDAIWQLADKRQTELFVYKKDSPSESNQELSHA
ncbi:hypothetical protein [Thiomicrospira pelophila]|uniref:hypothetical protein n=1 Tax=Thiomicrospira pelophila TaxID=934 RepID=UPI001FDF8B72|nr:hypothetical protein [Thiomicrospira pelophila]